MIGPVGSNNPGNGSVGGTVVETVVDGRNVDETVVEIGARIDVVVEDEETSVEVVVVGAIETAVVETVVNGGSG